MAGSGTKATVRTPCLSPMSTPDASAQASAQQGSNQNTLRSSAAKWSNKAQADDHLYQLAVLHGRALTVRWLMTTATFASCGKGA